MSTLYVSEYCVLPFLNGHPVVMAQEPPQAEQTITISGVSAQSSAFSGSTSVIRVHTDVVCSILVGTNPTATAAKKRLAANQTEYFFVSPGQKIAVISNT